MGSGGVRGSGDELKVGVAARPLAALLDELRTVLGELDAAQLPARDALDVVQVCDRISRVADAAKTLAAGRVAESSLWSRGGHRSAAHWMAKVCGVTVGDAARLLELAETVSEAPATKDALVAGTLSGRQAGAVGKAEKADPAAGRKLVASAPGRTFDDVKSEATRIVTAASQESPEEKAERHRRQRRVWHSVDADGMGIGGWRLPIAEHTKFVAGLEAEQAKVFDDKRRAGEREPVEAYAADGFCRLLDRALTTGSVRGGDGGSIDEDWSFSKVIVKIDLAALDRGSVEPGEVSEIAGQGPVPVPDVWRMIDGNAFIAAVTSKGSEISKVVHLGRRPTALQRTALEALGDGACDIEGCNSKARWRSTTSPTGPPRNAPNWPSSPRCAATTTTSRPTTATPSDHDNPTGSDSSSHPRNGPDRRPESIHLARSIEPMTPATPDLPISPSWTHRHRRLPTTAHPPRHHLRPPGRPGRPITPRQHHPRSRPSRNERGPSAAEARATSSTPAEPRASRPVPPCRHATTPPNAGRGAQGAAHSAGRWVLGLTRPDP